MTWLECGCCGEGFEGQADPAHDAGYGTCLDCEQWIAERAEVDWDKARDLMASALNDSNRGKFLGMDLALQRGIILSAIDDGILTFTINKGRALYPGTAKLVEAAP